MEGGKEEEEGGGGGGDGGETDIYCMWSRCGRARIGNREDVWCALLLGHIKA